MFRPSFNMLKRAKRMSAGEELAHESELFLSGRYGRHVAESEMGAPYWVWLSILAHGTKDEIVGLTEMPPVSKSIPKEVEPWRKASAFLAQELLTFAVKAPQGLSGLQQDVLIPLELDLTADPGSKYLGPSQFVNEVLVALRRFAHSMRHPSDHQMTGHSKGKRY
ncbi:MAG: hypothetical protein M1115_00210 [Actinobacteria bacterium]|nr:hypothetical protein [Actinomycetota bacterium]